MCFLAMNVITWFHVSTMYKEFITFFIKFFDFPSSFLVLSLILPVFCSLQLRHGRSQAMMR